MPETSNWALTGLGRIAKQRASGRNGAARPVEKRFSAKCEEPRTGR